MKSDLKNMISAAEASFADDNDYDGFVAPPGSSGVTLAFTSGGATGWSATASHASTAIACTIYVGSATPVGTAEGEPICV